MAKIINKRNVIGDRFKEAVASLISFTPTTTITGTNVQAALEEVDSHVLASAAISDDEFEATTEIPRDADTLCGVDGNQIISDLSECKTVLDYDNAIPITSYQTFTAPSDGVLFANSPDNAQVTGTAICGCTWNIGTYFCMALPMGKGKTILFTGANMSTSRFVPYK